MYIKCLQFYCISFGKKEKQKNINCFLPKTLIIAEKLENKTSALHKQFLENIFLKMISFEQHT